MCGCLLGTYETRAYGPKKGRRKPSGTCLELAAKSHFGVTCLWPVAYSARINDTSRGNAGVRLDLAVGRGGPQGEVDNLRRSADALREPVADAVGNHQRGPAGPWAAVEA